MDRETDGMNVLLWMIGVVSSLLTVSRTRNFKRTGHGDTVACTGTDTAVRGAGAHGQRVTGILRFVTESWFRRLIGVDRQPVWGALLVQQGITTLPVVAVLVGWRLATVQ